jgi:hypothetical protein
MNERERRRYKNFVVFVLSFVGTMYFITWLIGG